MEGSTVDFGTGTDAPLPVEPIQVDQSGGESEPLDVFCHNQIRIPPQLPSILKQFTKAAIRTQPRDLDVWATAYFRAMANGEVPPVKEILEYPAMESQDGLTIGLLRVLDHQVKN